MRLFIEKTMDVAKRLAIIDQLFGIFWGITLLGTFELFFNLWKVGAVDHPIWSTLFGFPIPHHLYLVEFVLLVIWNVSRRFDA